MNEKRPAAKNRAYVLRTCHSNLTSHGGFRWPEKGYVEAPDWDPEPHCGNGLHGALWGEGDGSLFYWSGDAKWLVVEVDERTVVDLNGKVKFPYGWVVYCGDRKGATDRIRKLGACGPVIGAYVTAGDRGTATAGYGGTAIAGDRGTATVGYGGTATAGDWGTASAGYKGTATAGEGGTAAAGYFGLLRLDYYYKRRRTAVAYVGERAPGKNGPFVVESNRKYRLSVRDDGMVYWVPTK